MLDKKKKRKGLLSIAMTGIFVLSVSLLVSCGSGTKEAEESDLSGAEDNLPEDSLAENNEIVENSEIPEGLDTAEAESAVVGLNVNEVEEEEYLGAKQKAEDAISADFGEDCIVLSEASDQTVINRIPISYDQYGLFMDMTDENSGYLLYCSTPAASLMEKIFYVTDDRWKTYQEMDISSLIDGYPNSLSVTSGGKIYIGTQTRSNGYLFASEDEGESWEAVRVDDDTYFMYGYAPVFEKENGKTYLFLRTNGGADDSEEYFLYQAAENVNSQNPAWERIGNFLLEDGDVIEEYFLYDGALYLTGSKGNHYQVCY